MVAKARLTFGLVLIFVATWIAGCTSPTFDSRRAMLEHNANVEAKIIFLADNQRTLSTSEPIFEQSQTARGIVQSSAHRRPAVENFSLDIVRHILETNDDEKTLPVIHVGDMLNNSCRSEFDDTMNSLGIREGRPVYVAPGNHDGFYLGITSPVVLKSKSVSASLLNNLNDWTQLCTPSCKKKRGDGLPTCEAWEEIKVTKCEDEDKGNCHLGFDQGNNLAGDKGYAANVLDKYSYVLAYLAEVGIRDFCADHGTQANRCRDQHGLVEDSLIVRCAAQPDPTEYLEEICWTEFIGDNALPSLPTRNVYECNKNECSFRETRPWRHFVVQHLVLPAGASDQPVHFFLLDTASYQPGTVFDRQGVYTSPLGYGAANNAQIRPLQRAILERWMRQIRRENGHAQVVLVGHHPLQDFDTESYEFIGRLAEYPNVTHYISGDTHNGHDIRHARLSNLREANLGATIDAPIEYALGGSVEAKGGHFDLARYSLTPAKGTRYGQHWPDRVYAESDGTFEQCLTRFRFDAEAPAFAPLGSSTTKPIIENRLLRPEDFFGVPYINYWYGIPYPNIFNWSKIRESSIYAYKINRTVDSLGVYRDIFEKYGLSWPTFYSNKEQCNQLNSNPLACELHDHDVRSFADRRKFENDGRYAQLHRRLSEFLDEVESEMAAFIDNEDIRWARLCSALFEAHRDKYGAKAPS